MAVWNDLPAEIHVQILRYFCDDIVKEFKLTNLKLERNHLSDPWTSDWPNAPACLRSFDAALRTCRSFWHAMNNSITVNGNSPVVEMQSIQAKNTSKFLDKLDYSWPHKQPNFLTALYQRVGCFWKNPILLKNVAMFEDILMWLFQQEASISMLIPHLEPWILLHAVNRSPQEEDQKTYSNLENYWDAYDVLDYLIDGDRFVPGRLGVQNIKGLADVDGEMGLDEEIPPMFDDIIGAPPNTWWFFPGENYLSLRDRFERDTEDEKDHSDEYGWCLVNYGLKMMHFGPYYGDAYYSWENVWEVE